LYRGPTQPIAVFRLHMCASQPSPAKPPSVIAYVDGSGTAGVVPSTSAIVIASSPVFSAPSAAAGTAAAREELGITGDLGAATSWDAPRKKGNLGPSPARAENVDCIFASGRDGERRHSRYCEGLGFRARGDQDRQDRRSASNNVLLMISPR
jgi:hypothetical protein